MRETGLLGLVAAVIWLTADRVDPYWTSADYGHQPHLIWIIVGSAVLTALLRLWMPSVALITAAALFGWWPASGIAVALTAFQVAARIRSMRRRGAVLALAAATGYYVGLHSAAFPWPVVAGLHVVTAVVCLASPVGVQTLLSKADLLVSALRERAQYLEENYRLAHAGARMQERSRIAQEMHDQLGHRLSLISLHTGALELASADKSSSSAQAARLIRATVQTAMHELRSILGVLRSAEHTSAPLQPVDETGTRSDITRLVDQSRSAGVTVTLTWQGADLDDIAAPLRRAVHRIVREGLTNVHRHAAGAATTLLVERRPDSIHLRVSNARNPRRHATPPLPNTGLGLVSAQERVRLLGGDFTAGPTPHGGFEIVTRLPLKMPAEPPTTHTVETSAGSLPAIADNTSRRGRPAVLALGLIGCGALTYLASIFLPSISPENGQQPAPPLEAGISVGTSRVLVVALIGPDDPVARLAARFVESPPPAGSNCTYIQNWTDGTSASIVRFCFRDDTLIALDRFAVR